MNWLAREKVNAFDYVTDVNNLMRDGGLLLVTEGRDLKPNAMTIGWGFIGTMWRRPFFIVAVRQSRYTFKLLEETNKFSVCLPGKNMENVLDICGSKSGRDINKFKELSLTLGRGLETSIPYIDECPVHYECVVAYKDRLEPGYLAKPIENEIYPRKNMHVMYYGEIKGVYILESFLNE